MAQNIPLATPMSSLVTTQPDLPPLYIHNSMVGADPEKEAILSSFGSDSEDPDTELAMAELDDTQGMVSEDEVIALQIADQQYQENMRNRAVTEKNARENSRFRKENG